MSQSGALRPTAGVLPPTVSTSFVTNSGIAVPALNILNVLGSTVAAGSNPFRSIGSGNTVTYQTQISQAIASTDATKIGLAAFDSASFAVDANGFVTMVGGSSYISLSPYIVGSDAHSGFATIASAIAQAVIDGASSSNPKNIYIKPKNGGYTENLTLSDGINLVGFGSSYFNGSSATRITGKITKTASGTASVNSLDLITNGDYVLEVTGANTLTVILTECFISASNANAIHLTNANSGIQLIRCQGDCLTNTYFIATGGGINCYYCILSSSTNTTTNSTIADCSIGFDHSFIACPITTSGTGSINSLYTEHESETNTVMLTHGGSGSSSIFYGKFKSGTSSAVSIGSTLPMVHCSIDSTNNFAITGAGTLQYAFIAFTNSSSAVNTSTVTPLATLI